MRVNIIHTDLNACGGAEQLALSTISAFLEMDADVELTTVRKPDLLKLKNAFGSERVESLFHRIEKINLLKRLPIDPTAHDVDSGVGNYDIVVNTHGDVLPYFLPSFSQNTAITYCHFPVAIDYMNSHNLTYLDYLADLGLIERDVVKDIKARNEMFQKLRRNYLLMLTRSLVVTNSNFSREAILKTLEKNHVDSDGRPLIVPPPVDVHAFRRKALYSADRRDNILVISRIHPSKKLENAISLARILKRRKYGKGMIIAGSLQDDDYLANEYYDKILNLREASGLSDFVTIETNVGLEKLNSLMKRCKVYFHPLSGEPFGISIVEAMSAGLIPIVTRSGGYTEFVPKKYQFGSLRDAAEIVSSALHADQEERIKLSNSVMEFSFSQYQKRVQAIVKSILTESSNELVILSEAQGKRTNIKQEKTHFFQ